MLNHRDEELIRAGWKAGALYMMLLRDTSPQLSPHTDHILARIRGLPSKWQEPYAARIVEETCADECTPRDIAEAANLLQKEIEK